MQWLSQVVAFLKRMWTWNRHMIKQCWLHLVFLSEAGVREAVVYGDSDAARLLLVLSRFSPVQIQAVCPVDAQRFRPWAGMSPLTPQELAAHPAPVIVALFVNLDRHLTRLTKAGVARDRLIVMQ